MSSFLYQNANLSLKELTMMLAMMTFVLAHHSSDLARLSVMGVHDLPQAVSIPLTRPGHADKSSVIITSFEPDPYIMSSFLLQRVCDSDLDSSGT